MSITGEQPQSFGAVMATGLTAQVVGGAVAVVFVYYYHQGGTTPPPEGIEQALGTIFSATISTVAMIGHLIIRKYLAT